MSTFSLHSDAIDQSIGFVMALYTTHNRHTRIHFSIPIRLVDWLTLSKRESHIKSKTLIKPLRGVQFVVQEFEIPFELFCDIFHILFTQNTICFPSLNCLFYNSRWFYRNLTRYRSSESIPIFPSFLVSCHSLISWQIEDNTLISKRMWWFQRSVQSQRRFNKLIGHWLSRNGMKISIDSM